MWSFQCFLVCGFRNTAYPVALWVTFMCFFRRGIFRSALPSETEQAFLLLSLTAFLLTLVGP